MHRFWPSIIQPLLVRLRPKVVVEIGCGEGLNTKNLLEFCAASGSVLHAIDPSPGFDVGTWQEEHGDRLVFHRGNSLKALPEVGPMDAVLIDGDHNWYTVFHELKLIERLSREHHHGFPLVMLHDIGWPYGRRDMYYDPETIPEEYRQPYLRKGMRPRVA